MLDPVIEFVTNIFHKIGQGIGWVIAALLWPFLAFAAWVRGRGIFIKGTVSLIVILLVVGYGFLFFQTQFTQFVQDLPDILFVMRRKSL